MELQLVIGIVVAFALAASQIAATPDSRPVPLRIASFHPDNVLGTLADFEFIASSPNG